MSAEPTPARWIVEPRWLGQRIRRAGYDYHASGTTVCGGVTRYLYQVDRDQLMAWSDRCLGLEVSS